MRGREVAVAVALIALACSGSPAPGAPAKAEPAQAMSALAPIWQDLGWPPAGWEGAAIGAPKPRFDRVQVEMRWPKSRGNPGEVLAAFLDAALARGWTRDPRYVWSEARASLQKTGGRVSLYAGERDGFLVLEGDYGVVEVVREDWPTHPTCPDDARIRAADSPSRICYRIGTELVRHGPYEIVEDGDVAGRGECVDGLEIGTSWRRWLDVGGTVYEVRTTWAADGSGTAVYAGPDGARVATRTHDAEGRRHGTWAWFTDGAASREVRWDHGTLDPAEGVRIVPKAQPTVGWNATLEILDVDVANARVAYRILTRPNSEADPLVCRYPGLADPGGGVTLGLYDVASGVQEWEVYGSFSDENKSARCTPEAEAARALAAAKAAWAAVGLDPGSKPPMIAPTIDGARSAVRVLGIDVTLEAENRSDERPISDVEGVIFGQSDPWEYSLGRWRGAQQSPIYFGHPTGYNEGSSDLALHGAWEADGQALVVWRLEHDPFWRAYGFVRVPGP